MSLYLLTLLIGILLGTRLQKGGYAVYKWAGRRRAWKYVTSAPTATDALVCFQPTARHLVLCQCCGATLVKEEVL